MSSIGQAVAGPRFYEMDDVRSVLFLGYINLICFEVVRQEENLSRQPRISAKGHGKSS